MWNKLDTSLQSECDINLFKQKLKNNLKPRRYKHFSRGSKKGNSLHTQLRVGRSDLNLHKFTIGLVESPDCLCHRTESVEHYLLHCFLFNEERRDLFDLVEHHIPNFSKFTIKKKWTFYFMALILTVLRLIAEIYHYFLLYKIIFLKQNVFKPLKFKFKFKLNQNPIPPPPPPFFLAVKISS